MPIAVICPRCEVARQESDFHRPEQGRRHGYCKPCRREYNREWYGRNKKRHIAHVRRNNERYLARNREYVEQEKDAPCLDCGQRFPSPVMEFDHVRGEKVADVSQLMRTGSLDSIAEEIEKCDLVCANCHRLRTAVRDWGYDLDEETR